MAVFTQSQWDTEYDSSGVQVHAIVTFSNDKGSYNIIDNNNNVTATGIMSNIKYFVMSDTHWLITGHWSLQGSSGAFQFNGAGGPDQFTGGWFSAPPQSGGGQWNGSRI
jgi:hypothetical protein